MIIHGLCMTVWQHCRQIFLRKYLLYAKMEFFLLSLLNLIADLVISFSGVFHIFFVLTQVEVKCDLQRTKNKIYIKVISTIILVKRFPPVRTLLIKLFPQVLAIIIFWLVRLDLFQPMQLQLSNTVRISLSQSFLGTTILISEMLVFWMYNCIDL